MEQFKNYLCMALTQGHYSYSSCCKSAVHLAQPQLPNKSLQSRTGTSPTAGPVPPGDSSAILAQHS